jgi:hypothetical protein
LPAINDGLPTADLFSTQEADRFLNALADETNAFMYAEGLVIRV